MPPVYLYTIFFFLVTPNKLSAHRLLARLPNQSGQATEQSFVAACPDRAAGFNSWHFRYEIHVERQAYANAEEFCQVAEQSDDSARS